MRFVDKDESKAWVYINNGYVGEIHKSRGVWVFWADEYVKITASELREIADELDRRNQADKGVEG